MHDVASTPDPGQVPAVPRHRQRVKARAVRRMRIDPSDAEAFGAWLAAVRPVVAHLRALAEEATARPAQRDHSRVFLRKSFMKRLRELEDRLRAVDPTAAPATAPAAV